MAEPEHQIASLADLFREHYLPMVRLAYLITGSNEVAEDVVQDAFVRVHRQWARVEEPAAYLRAVVVNRCRSWQRRQVLERQRRPGPPDQATGPQPDELLDALARLSPRRRAALVSRYYADLPEAEIAEALGCRGATVRSLIRRGLAQLKESIER